MTVVLAMMDADGTNVNTVKNNGVICLFEIEFQWSPQWFICLSYSIEYPLRHLIHKLDGFLSATELLTGDIGLKSPKVLELSVRKIKIPVCINVSNATDLSTHQKCLVDTLMATQDGSTSKGLIKRSPGKRLKVRWHALQTNVCMFLQNNHRMYLKQIANYTKVYVPLWFTIKCFPNCIYA